MADDSLHPAAHPTDRLIGTSPAIAALRAQIRHLAGFDTVGSPHAPTLLLTGETGTGKGLVARVMHDSGPRAAGPFVEVNCAAIPETMLEAELFGYEAGAFTDARRAKPGLFEAASGGTLFLDEVDALPLVLQGKLLTALETKRMRRLGAVAERVVDVKLIAATNAALERRVAAGAFRGDLYHRLAVVVLALPPLRERGADARVLAQAFLRHYTAAHGVPPKRLSAGAEAWLQGYAWPGNVRELGHVMERVTLLHGGDEVDAATLRQLCAPPTAEPPVGSAALQQEPTSDSAVPAEAERIRQALAQTGGNVVRAARLLGVSRDAVRYRMQRYGITRPRPESLPPPAPRRVPDVGFPGPQQPPLPHTQSERGQPSEGPEGRQNIGREAGTEPNVPTAAPAWEQKPVVVLALELTWPAACTFESPSYDLWTETARWEQAIVDKVRGFGGVLLQHTPALLTWVFGVPRTPEQLPQRAVHSALSIRHMVAEAGAADSAPCPKVRLAAHLGAVRLDSQAADPTARMLAVGDTLALPVRLLGQTAPGEILITSDIGRLVDGWVALEARPLHSQAGDTAQVDGYTVIGASPGREAWAGRRRSTRSPFVGRAREVALLDDVLARVQAGQGQVVNLVGAPGMGKSRLLVELRRRLSGQPCRYAEGQCLAYGSGMPYLPVVDLLRDHCGIAAGDGPETLTAKLQLALKGCGEDLETGLSLLLDLLGVPIETDRFAGLSADGRRARTFEALYRVFFAGGRQRPLVLAVDNLQWVDPTSEAFLAGLIERLACTPLLLLTTARPGYRPPWGGKSYVMQLTLPPLAPDASRQVVQHVLGNRSLAPTLVQQLLVKAEGNPFFLEELAHTVREQEGGDASLAVPNSVQAVLAARIDRLSPEAKHLLQMAAVIGLVVPFALLQAIAEETEETLGLGLAHLQTGEFLYETRLFPEREYTFKHALTHEVAYGGLFPERRRALHARIVEALEAQAGEHIADRVERLAHHALQGEVWQKALTYSRQAGERAMRRSAHREAVAYFEQALSAPPHLPEQPETIEQSIDLRLALRTALFPSGDFERMLALLREAEGLATAIDDRRRLGQVSGFLSLHFYYRGAYDQAIAAAERALAIATPGEDVALQVVANQYLGLAYRARGDYHRAIDCFGQAVAALGGVRCRERFVQIFLPAVISRALLAWCHAELGAFPEGRALGEEGLRIAEAVDHPSSLMDACYGSGLLALRQGDLPRALPRLERAVALCHEAEVPFFFPGTAAALGAAYTLAGRVADAIPLLTRATAQATATAKVDVQAFCHLSLGEALVVDGRLEDAHAIAEQSLALSHAHQERGHEAYALRLLGDIAARCQPSGAEQAAAYYRQALALADELSMRPLVAHCHRGLGALYSQTGRQAQAHTELLAAITLYRAQEMIFWLPETEEALARIGGGAARP